MAKRRTLYTWTIRYEDRLMATAVFQDVLAVMTSRQQMFPHTYSGGSLDGAQLGILQVKMVITGRDRWWCDRKAGDFARALALRAHVNVAEVKNPDPANLAPHTNRGYSTRVAVREEVPSGA